MYVVSLFTRPKTVHKKLRVSIVEIRNNYARVKKGLVHTIPYFRFYIHQSTIDNIILQMAKIP